jgi:hypothetical protein
MARPDHCDFTYSMRRCCIGLLRQRTVLVSRARALSGQTRFDRRYDVIQITASGVLKPKLITMSDVLSRFGGIPLLHAALRTSFVSFHKIDCCRAQYITSEFMRLSKADFFVNLLLLMCVTISTVHARDVISLGLQDTQHFNPPPAILPRGNVIVVAVGNFKALIYSDSCLVFEAKRPVVAQATTELAELMKLNHMNANGSSNGSTSQFTKQVMGENVMRTMFRAQSPVPFELAMLEAMLQEFCASQARKLSLMDRLVKDTLRRATSASSPDTRIDFYRLVPINVALKNFELSTAEARRCLTDLLHSDEDMLDLLLTAKAALVPGETLEKARHAEVEVCLTQMCSYYLSIYSSFVIALHSIIRTLVSRRKS